MKIYRKIIDLIVKLLKIKNICSIYNAKGNEKMKKVDLQIYCN